MPADRTAEERAREVVRGLRTASKPGWATFNAMWLQDAIATAIAAAVEAEREACRKIADEMFEHFTKRHAEAVEREDVHGYHAMSIGMSAASRIAAAIAIRARKGGAAE